MVITIYLECDEYKRLDESEVKYTTLRTAIVRRQTKPVA